MKNLLIPVFLFLFFGLYSIALAETSDYYTQTRLNTLYNQTGESLSTLKITLRNLTSKNFPSSLKVYINGPKVNFLTVKDDYGDLNYLYSYEPTGINTLEVKFNRRMVGKDVLTHLNLTYKNPGKFFFSSLKPFNFSGIFCNDIIHCLFYCSCVTDYTFNSPMSVRKSMINSRCLFFH